MNKDLTKDGVCYRIERSPFYQFRNGYVFYFSSHAHLLKFQEKVKMKEDWLTDSMSRRFHYPVDMAVLADFQLYDQIEKRGFLVRNAMNGEEYTCRDSLRLGGLVAKLNDCEMQ